MSKKDEHILQKNVCDVIATPQGKDFVWELLSMCDVYSNAFSVDQRNTDYMLGRQSVGRELLQLLEDADPKFYPRLILAKQEKQKDG